MKKLSLTQCFKTLAAVAVLGSAASGFAATTWTPGASSLCDFSSGSYKQCDGANVTVNSVKVTANAYSAINTGPATSQTFSQSKLYDYGSNHLGVVSTGESAGTQPEHAMDNVTYTDLISLKFGSSVALTDITTGYANGDSDMSVLAYKGSNGSYDIAGKTIAALLADNWVLVSNINGGDSAASYNFNTAGAVTSSWWIVSAFNSGFGGNANGASMATADYMKLLSVASNPQTPPGKVPEPGSLALMGAAFCAFLGVRRRKAKAASI